jgi:hypothetical protein
VNPNGTCVFAGRLADGQAVSYGGWIGLDGVVPVFTAFGATEIFSGPVHFSKTPDHGFSMAASLQWFRIPQSKDPRFPAGFAMVCKLLGARYHAPSPLQNLLTLQSGPVAVEIRTLAASWAAPRSDLRTLQPRGLVSGTSAGFQLTTDPRSGLFSGTLLDPQKKARHFGGVFLQGFSLGGGSFLTDKEPGALELKVTPPPAP